MGWSGLEWIGVGWSGLEWIGVGWSGLEWVEVAWSGLEPNSIKPILIVTRLFKLVK